jgi:hypothetical protein
MSIMVIYHVISLTVLYIVVVAVVTMDKYLTIKKTGKGSGHNEKVNKRKTLVEKDT